MKFTFFVKKNVNLGLKRGKFAFFYSFHFFFASINVNTSIFLVFFMIMAIYSSFKTEPPARSAGGLCALLHSRYRSICVMSATICSFFEGSLSAMSSVSAVSAPGFM